MADPFHPCPMACKPPTPLHHTAATRAPAQAGPLRVAARLKGTLAALLCVGALVASPVAWGQAGAGGGADGTTISGAATYAEVQRLIANREWVLARQRLEHWLQSHDSDPQARLLLGVVLAGQGDSAGAQRLYEQLTQAYPELPEPYNNLAVLHAAAGRLPEARAALEWALRFHPDYAVAHRNLGDVYAQLALGHWQRALALQPDTPGLGARAAALRRLLHPGAAADAPQQ
ncbi:putative PEP-CTERM system TPR-repeat lipoprotein [Tepidimonas thermarum]|uniref:Putative PEP-CTERM system TPR-repeat lipoprotein n=2 Tax=Tepidimonas thermarum TaxID=335431 RepID=A0A554X596_9BURK|nr:putative PEP-CTERM system TPR-repeat lipoprotein [Tepidimonas thermarum]